MNIRKACAIFEQIASDKYTDAEKLEAAREVVAMPTHNGITKSVMLDVLRWFSENTEEAAEVPRWIPVTPETMPRVEQEVIVRYAYASESGITHAMYHDGTVRTENSDHTWKEIYEWGDYDEETDDYFIPKGWYETNHFGEYIDIIDWPITHWMPLPEPPEVEG